MATAKERAAYAFARKFTLEPHRLSDSDIQDLRKHYTNAQILEMILSMAGNNAINRWKEGVGVPQSESGGGFGRKGPDGQPAPVPEKTKPHSYLSPTSEKYKSSVTRVAPLVLDPATGLPTRKTLSTRPALESRAETEKALAMAHTRTPRLPLVEETAARKLTPEDFPTEPLPQWVRLLATFTNQGKSRINSQWAAEQKGDLSPLLKAQVSWIVARQDRAWYATGEAKRRLNAMKWSDDQLFKLDGDWSEFTPKEQALFTVAKKLAASPIVLTDSEVDAALKLAGPRDVVQLISYVTTRASFNRITEAAGLQIEP